MVDLNFIEARYGDLNTIFSYRDEVQSYRIRQAAIWKSLISIVGLDIEEPWTYEVHSPRALPAFLGRDSASTKLIWDAGIGTIFNQLSFSMPYRQPDEVMEAFVRRVAAIRCLISGYEQQAALQIDRATELLRRIPIDRSFQEFVDAEDQFEVFLLTEMQERFVLAHELAHYIFSLDANIVNDFGLIVAACAETYSGKVGAGVLRPSGADQVLFRDTSALYDADLDPYAWYLDNDTKKDLDRDWPSDTDEVGFTLAVLEKATPTEYEEIMCDVLAALAVSLDAHKRGRGWTAHMAAASSRLALANLQSILTIDEWVANGGDVQPVTATRTSRQHCLGVLLSCALPEIFSRCGVETRLSIPDLFSIMFLVEGRVHERLGPGLSRLNWIERQGEIDAYDIETALLLAGFMPLRPSADHRSVNRTAGGHKFELGIVRVSSKIYEKMLNSEKFTNEIDDALKRHRRGDWGDVPQEDWESNNSGLFEEFCPSSDSRLLRRDALWSVFKISDSDIMVKTYADRSVTYIRFLNESF